MPYTDIEGIGPGSIVDNTGDKLYVGVGENLIGRVINAVGEPIDGKGSIKTYDTYSIAGEPQKVEFGDRVVGIIESRDGTIMDVVREVKPFEFSED